MGICGKHPKMMEVLLLFAKTLIDHGNMTPTLGDFIAVRTKDKLINDLKIPANFDQTCKEADTLNMVPPLLIKEVPNAKSVSLVIPSVQRGFIVHPAPCCTAVLCNWG
jgi:hypothetical protein